MTYEVDAKRGVANHYGVRTTDGSKGAQSQSVGLVKQAVWEFTWNNLPAGGTNNLQFSIPSDAYIKSATFYVDDAWTSTSGTSDLTVYLERADGTNIGVLLSATDLESAELTDGAVITGTGGLLGSHLNGHAGELVIEKSVDDFTAGSGRIVVEYVYGK